MNYTQNYRLHVRGVQASSITTNLGELKDVRKLEFVGEVIPTNYLIAVGVRHLWISSVGSVAVKVTDPISGDILAEAKGVRSYVSEFDTPVTVTIEPENVDIVPVLNIQTLSTSLNLYNHSGE